VIDQHLHWNPGSPEAGRSRKAIGIDPHNFLQPAKEFWSHEFTLQQNGDVQADRPVIDTSVSTAIMAPHRFPANGIMHPLGRVGLALGPQTTGHLFESGLGETGDMTDQNSTAGFLGSEFGVRPRSKGSSDSHRQRDLAIGRMPRCIHR
jgi:hypothetical protein